MLTLYRRHLKNCDHRNEGRSYRRCKCPVWVAGLLGCRELKESLRTRNWETASDLIHTWEARGSKDEEKKPELMTIAKAWEEFQADARIRGLRSTTIYKYLLLERQMGGSLQTKDLQCSSNLTLTPSVVFGPHGRTAHWQL
jgi:hypothetical protein